jgi:mannose-6-phosphate isomerase-like protein (cupin superfamily)
VLLLGFASGACVAMPKFTRPPVRVLAAGPVDPSTVAGFRSELLFATEAYSVHRALLNEALRPHYHRFHAETVVVLSGRARLRIGDAWHELGPRSIAHVPRGVVHEVQPLEPGTPLDALSIFSPPFAGTDRVFVKR